MDTVRAHRATALYTHKGTVLKSVAKLKLTDTMPEEEVEGPTKSHLTKPMLSIDNDFPDILSHMNFIATV